MTKKQDSTRDGSGRFKKGHSGNPAGRAGSQVARLRESIVDHVPAIITKLVKEAKAGDVQAAKLLLERVVPPLRAESIAMQFPELEIANGLAQQGAAVVQAVARGEIPASIGAELLAGLGRHARLVELDELEKRLTELEAKNGQH